MALPEKILRDVYLNVSSTDFFHFLNVIEKRGINKIQLIKYKKKNKQNQMYLDLIHILRKQL